MSAQYSLDGLLTTANAPHGFPAAVACIASADEILAVGAIGVPVWGQSGAVTSDSRFHIGSITKSMTATMIATIVEAGELSWTSRPAEVLMGQEDLVHPALREVQLQHLLSHRAGIAPFEQDEEIEAVGPFDGTPREQRAQFAAYLLQQPPAATPIEEFSYSNAGYAIAAAMAEKATDTPWETLMAKRFLTPLGLSTGGIGWPALSHPGEPWGHYKRGDVFVPHDPHDAYQVGPLIAPAGDLHMSVLDLARHGQTHLRGLRGEVTLVSAETMRKLHMPFGAYSLGWSEGESGSQHSGSAATFFAAIILRPQVERVYAFITNAYEDESSVEAPAHIILATQVLREMREMSV